MKKLILGVVAVLFLISGTGANAQTVDVAGLLAQIQGLQSQIAALTESNAALQARINILTGIAPSNTPFCYNVKGFLGRGDDGVDVATLHTALIKYGYGADISAGEISQKVYGEGTSIAVGKLQGAQNLRNVGNVGPQTDAFLKKIFPCSKEVVPPATPIVITSVRGPAFSGVIQVGKLATISYTGSIEDENMWKVRIQGKAQDEIVKIEGSKTVGGLLSFTVPNLSGGEQYDYEVFLQKSGKIMSNRFKVQVLNLGDSNSTNKAPRVSITSVFPARPQVGDYVTIRFNSSDPESQRMTWDLHDGTGRGGGFIDKNGETVTTARYTEPGTYTIRVSVSDGVNTVTDSKQITVVTDSTPNPTNKPPRVTINSLSAIRPKVGDAVTVRYTAADPEGQNVTTRVTWGDEPQNTEARFVVKTIESDSHSYTSAGNYTLTVSVTDGVNTVSDTRQITVVADPTTLESKVTSVVATADVNLNAPVPAGTYINVSWAGQNLKGTVTAKLFKHNPISSYAVTDFVQNIRTNIQGTETGGTLGFSTTGIEPGYYVVQIIPTGVSDTARGAYSGSIRIGAAAPVPAKNPVISNVLLNGLASSFTKNRGDALTITWTRNDDVVVNKIEILNYTKVVRTITMPATGVDVSYLWKIPSDLPLGVYGVRVVDKTGVSAASTASFTIVPKN